MIENKMLRLKEMADDEFKSTGNIFSLAKKADVSCSKLHVQVDKNIGWKIFYWDALEKRWVNKSNQTLSTKVVRNLIETQIGMLQRITMHFVVSR